MTTATAGNSGSLEYTIKGSNRKIHISSEGARTLVDLAEHCFVEEDSIQRLYYLQLRRKFIMI